MPKIRTGNGDKGYTYVGTVAHKKSSDLVGLMGCLDEVSADLLMSVDRIQSKIEELDLDPKEDYSFENHFSEVLSNYKNIKEYEKESDISEAGFPKHLKKIANRVILSLRFKESCLIMIKPEILKMCVDLYHLSAYLHGAKKMMEENIDIRQKDFDDQIDKITNNFQVGSEFIFSFKEGAYINKARTSIRKLEREIVSVDDKTNSFFAKILKLVNTMSDVLFAYQSILGCCKNESTVLKEISYP